MHYTGLLIFSLLLLFVTHDEVSASMSSYIIGGEEAEQNGYPYQASIRVHGQHKCGGSLLNRHWILTSAHCVIKYYMHNLIIVLGSNSLIYGGVAFRVIKRDVHPAYVVGEHHDDLALLKLHTPCNYTKTMSPIDLPNEDTDDSDDIVATFTGWDISKNSTSITYDLQVTELSVIDLKSCQCVFPSVTSSNICTRAEPGRGLCYGDAGGPLVYNGCLIGIGSWGSPCARGYPDVHIRVYSYIDWIKPIIRSESDD